MRNSKTNEISKNYNYSIQVALLMTTKKLENVKIGKLDPAEFSNGLFEIFVAMLKGIDQVLELYHSGRTSQFRCKLGFMY